MCQKLLLKKLSELYKKGGCPQQLQLPDTEWPLQHCITELKNWQWWQMQSAQCVYFALNKSANFQRKPGVDISGLYNWMFQSELWNDI